MTDDSFLAAVLEDPGADAPRLVYADWLEERGDPRAELLRAECQYLSLPPTDERGPALRTRLEQLCRALDPDWVALVRRLPMRDAVEDALARLEDLLPGLNYVVSLSIHRAPLTHGATPEEYVRAALGPKAVVGGTQPVPGAGMLGDVEGCLRYPGDQGHGPDPEALRSPEFNELVQRVMDYLGRSVAEASTVTSFWLREGNPVYPVMWGFGYVLVKRRTAVVFLGASSD